MNLWDIFFTTQATEPPKFDLFWYVSIIYTLGFDLLYSLSLSWKEGLPTIFPNLAGGSVDPAFMVGMGSIICLCQKVLPFTYCRMAMFVVLLLPGQSKYRQYFALLGTFGTLAAFVYPVSDAYPSHILRFYPYLWPLSSLGELFSLSMRAV